MYLFAMVLKRTSWEEAEKVLWAVPDTFLLVFYIFVCGLMDKPKLNNTFQITLTWNALKIKGMLFQKIFGGL